VATYPIVYCVAREIDVLSHAAGEIGGLSHYVADEPNELSLYETDGLVTPLIMWQVNLMTYPIMEVNLVPYPILWQVNLVTYPIMWQVNLVTYPIMWQVNLVTIQ
jgi:hypothetical protein